MKNIIYKVVNKVNNKIYIGLTTKGLSNRKYFHIYDALSSRCKSIFHKAIRKYGIEQFEWSIIWDGDKDLLNKMEIYFIKEYNSKLPNGYNMSDGGEGASHSGYKLSDETKLKMSISRTGKKIAKHSIESNIKLSIKKTGVLIKPDLNFYIFEHPTIGIFIGTKYQFIDKFNLTKSVYKLMNGSLKSLYNWKLINIENKIQ